MSVLKGALGGALGVDGGWLPLPTRPQRDCDPASLVLLCPVLIGGGWRLHEDHSFQGHGT